MGKRYKQLSAEERVKIYHWHANGKSARWIGEALGRQAADMTPVKIEGEDNPLTLKIRRGEQERIGTSPFSRNDRLY